MTTSTHSHAAVVLPSLVRQGFSPTVDLVFRTLRTHGPRGVGSLARELGLPVRQVSESLDALRADGLVRDSATGATARNWSAASAARTADVLKARLRARCGAPPPVDPMLLRGPESLGPGILHLPTRATARARMAALAGLSRHEHLTFNPEPRFDETSVRKGVDTDRKLIERGVKLRIIGVQPRDPTLLRNVGVDASSAFTYREASHRPTTTRGGADRAAGSRVDRCQAARRLRISGWSVSNIMRGLMDRFCVQNRFQLAIVLDAGGVIDPRSPTASETFN